MYQAKVAVNTHFWN